MQGPLLIYTSDIYNRNDKKTRVVTISRKPSAVRTMIGQKQLENVEYFSYLSTLVTNDARCTREIQSRIAMTKAALNKKKKTLFTCKCDFKF
jgi:hypothetical protein